MKANEMATGQRAGRTARRSARAMILMAVLGAGLFLAGCSDDDCLNCADLPPPVVPTGVHSISGDGYVIVQWNDLVYSPYDGAYNEHLVSYEVYRRYYEFGDENNPNRTFDPVPIATIDWDENYDSGSGLHWYVDENVTNGSQYEYAVASVNAAGDRSALSYEFVVDAPLPMSPLDNDGWFVPLAIFDGNAVGATGYGFVFARAAASPGQLNYGRVTPGVEILLADIEVFFSSGTPFVTRGGNHVRLQDLGDFNDGFGNVLFEGVTWAPVNGYSATGTMELVAGHVYVAEITTGPGTVHFAKFGVDSIGSGVVNIIWAYQLIANLPELSAPSGDRGQETDGPRLISL
jgi:hypothetical protein